MRLLAIFLPLSIFLLPQSPTITINPPITYQTISGWEAVSQAGIGDFTDWDLYKDSLMDQAIADGLNRFKVNLKMETESNSPTGGPVNDNSDPFMINPSGFQWGRRDGVDQLMQPVLMARTRLAARGEPMPFVVLGYVDFDIESFEHHTNAEEYAELIEASFLHINSTYGFIPDAVEIILEADLATGWTPTKIANCLLAARNRLANRGWHPRFIVPATTSCPAADTWYNDIKAANSNVIQYVDELSYHRYVNCDSITLNQNKTAAAIDGNFITMGEWIGADYHTLHADLKANAVAWEQFTLAYNNIDNGAHYYLVNHTNSTVTISSRMKFLRQYFKYVRRGAVRIEATGNSTFDPIAFINTDGKQVVIVKTSSGGSFSVGGLNSGTYGIKYTTASQYDVDLNDQTVSGTVSTSIPEAGVLTIYQKDGSSSPSPTPTPTPEPSPCPSPSPCACPSPTPTPEPTPIASGAPQIQSVGTTSVGNGQSFSFPFSHSGNYLILAVEMNGGGRGVWTVTYAGQSLTKPTNCHVEHSGNPRSEFWVLANPPSSGNVIVKTFGAPTNILLTPISLTGVASVGPCVGATGTSNSPSISVSVNSGEIAIDSLAHRATTSDVPNQTQLFNANVNIYIAGAGSWKAGPTSGMSWTLGASKYWAHLALPVK